MRILSSASILLLMIVKSLPGYAQDIEFSAVLDKNEVGINERFEIAYELNHNQGDFKEPEFADFKIISGPNRSSSMKFENGVQTSNSAFKYFLQPLASGTFNLPQTEVEVDGKTYKSQKISITVTSIKVKESIPLKISKDDAYVELELDRTNLGPDEVTIAKYWLYSKYDRIKHIDEFNTPIPEGMWVTELRETALHKSEKPKEIKGVEYDAYLLKTELWEPLRTGKFEPEPFSLSIAVSQKQQPKKGGGIFAQFMANYVDTTLTFTSGPISVEVSRNAPITWKSRFQELLISEPTPIDPSAVSRTIIAIDLTASMMCKDVLPNRITVIKKLMQQLVKTEKTNEFGVIAYTDNARLLLDFTADQKALQLGISGIQLDYTREGTSQAMAIFEGVEKLASHPGRKNLILATDGQNNSGWLAPITAAKAADHHQVKVHSILTGKEGESECLMLVGDSVEYKHRIVEIEDRHLKQIAAETNGLFLKLDDVSKIEELVGRLVAVLSKE